MRKKFVSGVIALIGLGTFVVLGSSQNLIDNLVKSAQESSFSNPFLTSSENKKSKSKPNSTANDTRAGYSVSEEPSSDAVPDRIVYFILFSHLVGLKNQADQLRGTGKSPFDPLSLYEAQANLDETESQILFQTAKDCLDAIQPIDQQAKGIIDAPRANFANGEVPGPKSLPPPPPELASLQQQKDDVILQHRDALKSSWGDAKFAAFDQFARGKIAPQITSLSKTNFTKKGGAE